MDKQSFENLQEVTNVYRTNDYIVAQVMGFMFDDFDTNVIVSTDTYYRRTKKRDAKYELMFCNRKNINGKRLPSNMFVRTYVD